MVNKIKAVRFKRKMTQADVFKHTGIQISKLSLIERGYIKATTEEAKKIAKALSCTMNEVRG